MASSHVQLSRNAHVPESVWMSVSRHDRAIWLNRPLPCTDTRSVTAASPLASGFLVQHGPHLLVGLVTVFFAVLRLWYSGNESWLPLDHKMVERIYQVLAFVLAAMVTWLGIRFDSRVMVNLGAAYFVLCLYLKLVDWWWDWMPRFLFFFLVGAIAIGLLLAFRKLRERTV